VIKIDQRQFSNAAAGKRFDSPGTHSADTYDSNMSIAYFLRA